MKSGSTCVASVRCTYCPIRSGLSETDGVPDIMDIGIRSTEEPAFIGTVADCAKRMAVIRISEAAELFEV
jgi:hypothetical protein